MGPHLQYGSDVSRIWHVINPVQANTLDPGLRRSLDTFLPPGVGKGGLFPPPSFEPAPCAQ